MPEGSGRPTAPFGTRRAEVVDLREAGPYVILTALDREGPVPAAGQFYMVRTARAWGGGEDGRAYLPRALSFARCREQAGELALDFLFERVGPGTRRLGEAVAGEDLVLTGPFGNGFAIDRNRESLLVAGGIGLAPIVALADEMGKAGMSGRILAGMRSDQHALAVGHFGVEAEIATDDGSLGHHGFVTELLASSLEHTASAATYACGPPAMLESVRSACEVADAPAQLAMESGMACGFGACHGCVVPTKAGYLRLCLDGPVVEASRLGTANVPGVGH